MNKITHVFQKKAFIGFLVADTGVEAYAEALVDGGVDLLEIGLPFSDPIADGPVIQQASYTALQHGVTPELVLDRIEAIKSRVDVPIVLFSYYNPLFKKGKAFLKKMKEKGCDGVLVVDLPLEEGKEFTFAAKEAGLETIFIAAPSSSEERILLLNDASSGFLYYACQKGTTGKRDELPSDIIERLKAIKKKTTLPIAVGFGISTKKQASDILKVADGFIVGSAFVELMHAKCSPKKLKELARSLDPRSSK